MRPLAQLCAVAIGHSQHFGNHCKRKREGKISNEVHLFATSHYVEMFINNAFDHRGKVGDTSGGEHAAHQLAQPRVIRRINVENRRVFPRCLVGKQLGTHLCSVARVFAQNLNGLSYIDTQGDVTKKSHRLGVFKHNPRTKRRLLDRLGFALDLIFAIGILGEARHERIEHLKCLQGVAQNREDQCGNSRNGVVRSLLGSRGRPSTRSPTMLRCTSSVPPPMRAIH